MQKSLVAVVILNYNGKKLLQQYLPSVIKNSVGYDIYLADNASTDDSVDFTEAHFPEVKVLRLGSNFGFAKGYNEALKQVSADYFVLLNSDVEVTNGWIEPVIELMKNDQGIAAAQPKVLSYTEKSKFEYAGACGGFIDKYGYPFCRGRLFNVLEDDKGQYNDTVQVFWATGACMFVRADVFRETGGFDDLFFAHMEEIDLCWRMRNNGRKVYVVPASVVYHLGGGTLHKISPRKTFLNFRNNLITLTKNYPGNWLPVFLLRLVLDGIAGFKFLLEGKPAHTWAVVRAHFAYYCRLPQTLSLRKKYRSDKDFNANNSLIYSGSVVADHYLRKKTKFSELEKQRFTV